jgi:hypothetical protein
VSVLCSVGKRRRRRCDSLTCSLHSILYSIRVALDLRLPLGAPSRLPLLDARTHSFTTTQQCRRRIHHGAKTARIGPEQQQYRHCRYTYTQPHPSDKPLPLSPLFKPCASQTQGAPPAHSSGCHAHGTLVAYRTPIFLDKTPSPATSRISPPALQNYRPCRSFSCSLVVSSRSVTTTSRTTLSLSLGLQPKLLPSFWLPNTTNPCPSDPSHSLDEQLDCRPPYR